MKYNKLNLELNFGGFYESTHSQFIDYSVETYFQDDNGNISEKDEDIIYDLNYDKFNEIYLKNYTEFLNEELGVNLEYNGYSSLRYYNFSTDKLEVSFDLKEVFTLKRFIIEHDLKEELIKYITNISTSHDGYIAFYSYDEILENKNYLYECYFDVIINYIEDELDQYLDFNNVSEQISNEVGEMI